MLKTKVKKIRRKKRTMSKHIFLTHPNMPAEMSIWTFIRALEQRYVWARGPDRGKSKIDAFCVGRELHESGRPHFHTYLRMTRKINHTVTGGDVAIDGISYHGNYQAVRSVNAVLTYCRKGGDYVEHNLISGLAHTVVKSRDEFDLLMALDRAGRHRQRPFWTRVYELYRERAEHERRLELTRHIVSFKWYSHFIKPETEMGWLKPPARRPKGLMLTGPSETGKSSFIAKFARERPYFIATEPRHFTNYSGEAVIALDEFTWSKWRSEIPFLKNLVTGLRVSTPSYYGSHLLATPRQVIVCTNEDPVTWSMPSSLCNRFYVYYTGRDECLSWSGTGWQQVPLDGGDSSLNEL